jgi:hypothetical protein
MKKRTLKFAHALGFGFFIPGSLGAALTWFVQAVAAYWRSPPGAVPSKIEFAFAIWFTVYQALWFMQSWEMAEDSSKRRYGLGQLLLDFLEMAVIFAVLGILSVNPGETTPDELAWLWLAVGAVAVIAIFSNSPQILKDFKGQLALPGATLRFGLAGVAAVVAIGTALTNLFEVREAEGWLNIAAFALIVLLTAVYAVQVLRGTADDRSTAAPA